MDGSYVLNSIYGITHLAKLHFAAIISLLQEDWVALLHSADHTDGPPSYTHDGSRNYIS